MDRRTSSSHKRTNTVLPLLHRCSWYSPQVLLITGLASLTGAVRAPGTGRMGHHSMMHRVEGESSCCLVLSQALSLAGLAGHSCISLSCVCIPAQGVLCCVCDVYVVCVYLMCV
jgi:hypothetical protein